MKAFTFAPTAAVAALSNTTAQAFDGGPNTTAKEVVIQTHAGMFHADEVSACALVRLCYPEALVRVERYDRGEEMPELRAHNHLRVDVGGVYNPDACLFDHHQDRGLPASNILVARQCLTAQVLEHLAPTMGRVSDIDTGKDNGGGPAEFNATIKVMNSLPDGFVHAVEVATVVVAGWLAQALAIIVDRERYSALERNGKVRIQTTGGIITCWKECAAQEGVEVLVHPVQGGQYGVTVRDTNVLQLPQDERFIFLHAARFFGTVADLETALAIALSL